MPKVKGPKEGPIITATFDGKGKSLFPSLKSTKDLILLSVRGNEYCSGDFLASIVKQAVDTHQTPVDYSGTKGKATLLVADELYWHNLKPLDPTEVDVNELKRQAIEIGDNYILSNLSGFLAPLAPLAMTVEQFNETYPKLTVDETIATINKLAEEQGKNFEIVRWKTWASQNNKEQELQQMSGLYDQVEGLSHAISKTQEYFVTRHAKKGDEELWRRRSHDYLVEESPAVMWLAASLGYNFVIYPGEILPSFVVTKDYWVVSKHTPQIVSGMNIIDECKHDGHCLHVDKPSSLVNWLEVNFTRSFPSTPKPLQEVSIESSTTTLTGDKQSSSRRTDLSCLPVELSKSPRDKMSFFSVKGNYPGHDTGYVNTEVEGMLLSSLLGGVGKTFRNTYSMNECIQTPPSSGLSQTSSALSEAFAGITRGLLTANISQPEKIDFLVALIDGVINLGNNKSPGLSEPIAKQVFR